jgi:hypothetical protein
LRKDTQGNFIDVFSRYTDPTAVIYPACRRFSELKARSKAAWLRYL